MSLSWRKRQALASDQKTWRGLGHDSALWTSIENNASTVNTVVAGPSEASRSGIVTGLRFIKTQGLANFNAMNTEQFVYASDPSDNSVASISGVNQYNTLHTNNGSGLIFSIRKFGAEPFDNAPIGTDISGTHYIIHNGGSGYRIGDDILLSGDGFERGVRITLTDNDSGATSASGSIAYPQLPTSGTNGVTVGSDGIITQDAYNVISVSITNSASAGGPFSKGCPVTIHSSASPAPGNVLARGFLRDTTFTAPDGTTPSGPQTATFSIDVPANQNFNQTALSLSFDITNILGLATGYTTFQIGSVTNSFPQANGFIPATSAEATNLGITQSVPGQLDSGEIIMQTIPEFQTKTFEIAGSPLRNSAGAIILSAFQMSNANPTPNATQLSTATNTIRTAEPKLTTSLLNHFNGVLAARVTSVADTTPVQGRN